MSDDTKFFLAVVGVSFAFIGGVFLAAYFVSAHKCGERARMMRLQHDYGLMTGCMVDTGDRWAPIEYIRILDGKVSIQGNGE